MKYLLSFATMSLFLSAACSSAPSGQEICDRVAQLCPTGGGGDAGVSITLKCDSAKFDTVSNKEDVKKCLDDAKDCVGATGCLLTAKQ
jgi:hypothetical protein